MIMVVSEPAPSDTLPIGRARTWSTMDPPAHRREQLESSGSVAEDRAYDGRSVGGEQLDQHSGERSAITSLRHIAADSLSA